MTVIEITLLILGALIFAASFIIPELKLHKGEDVSMKSEEKIKEVIDHEITNVKERIDEVVEETVEYAMEKTERSLAKVSNEKIMAVNEYSNTVLEEINRNHKEVMFLYDMLNDKQIDIKNTVRKVEATKEEAMAAVMQATSNEGYSRDVVKTEAFTGTAGILQKSKTPEQFMKSDSTIKNGQDTDKTSGGRQMEQVKPQPIFSSLAENMGNILLSTTQEKKILREATKPPVLTETEEIASINKMSHDFSTVGGSNNNNNSRILKLHKEGKSNIAIAKELGLGLGEVKLVLDLFEGM
jgi:DNA-binding NarL/FixJ family response regulator